MTTEVFATMDAAPTMSTALVIGIGGSGVQTLGRLRRALRDESRPDTTRVDNVHLLAIDAVGQDRQFPELPSDAHLAEHEYYSVVGDPAPNAYTYVKAKIQDDRVLRQSWDLDYTAPNEPLTDGLKRSRPLGDLAFEVNRAEVRSQIEALFSRALQADDRRAMYEASTSARLPVFIAASTAGGTGASGFLHILHAVHWVAAQRGIALQVYPVLFLPRVFYDAVGLGPSPAVVREGHRANAYAFFAELEAAVTQEGFLDEHLTRGNERRVADSRTAQDLVATAFLIDGQLSDGTVLSQPAAYQLAADSLFALLLTDGNNRLGIEGTNQGAAGVDDAEVPQRRIYGSLAAFAVTYPGNTYRRYLLARTRAYLLDKVLIDTDAIETQVGVPLAETLKEQMKGLTAGVGRKFNALDEVKDLIAKANQAGDDILDVSDISGMQAELGQLDYNVTQATAAMTRVAPGLRQDAQSRIEGVIDDALANSGEGTEVLVWALNIAAQDMAKLAKEATDKRTVQEQGLEGITNPNGELATAREDLQKAWTAFLPLRHKEKKDAAAAYGEVAVQYAGKIVDVQTAAVAETVLAAARDSLIAAHSEVRAAERTLRGMFTRAQDLWRSDELAGKDAGVPGQTLFLVPSDVLPQVEDSALALAGWERVLRQLTDEPSMARSKEGGRDWLRAFHRDLRLLGHTRGIRAIGSRTDARAQERARDQFRDQLATLAERLSTPGVSLPGDLVVAAGQADAIASGREYDAGVTNGAETQRLHLALSQIGQKALMPLNYELGRARFQGAETVDPPVLVIASADPLTSELTDRLPTPPNRHVPSGDPERVALTAVLSGLTIGMVLGLDDWYYSYQRVMENRAIRREKANQPPPHLKRSMRRGTSEPLVRRAYRESQIAELVVRAFALPDAEVLPLVAEDVDAGNETIRQVVGLHVEVRDGQIVAVGEPWVLGTTLVEWFDAVGRESRLHTAIDVSWGHIHRQAFKRESQGDPSLVEALRERAADWLEFNDEEWNRLRDLAGATAETAAEAAIRGSLVVAGRKLLTEALQRHAPHKRHVGA